MFVNLHGRGYELNRYGLNPPSLKFIVKVLTTLWNVTVLGEGAFKEVVKLKRAHTVGLNPNDCCPYKKRRLGHRHTQREDHVKTHGEDSCLQTKEGGPRRNQPCLHLDLGLLVSNCEKINFRC